MASMSFPRLEVPLPEFFVADADGWVHFQGQRVGLSSVVWAYLDGYSPEMLVSEYPALSLATIHKAIAFYLEHRGSVDRYMQECNADMTAQRVVGTHGPSLDQLRQRLSERALLK